MFSSVLYYIVFFLLVIIFVCFCDFCLDLTPQNASRLTPRCLRLIFKPWEEQLQLHEKAHIKKEANLILILYQPSFFSFFELHRHEQQEHADNPPFLQKTE